MRIWPLTEHMPYQPKAVKSYKQARGNAIVRDKLLLVCECRDLSRAETTLYTTQTYRSAQCVKMKTQWKQKGYTRAPSHNAERHQWKSITPKKKTEKDLVKNVTVQLCKTLSHRNTGEQSCRRQEEARQLSTIKHIVQKNLIY